MFNKLFDLNNDGKLDAAETALEFMLFQEIMSEEPEDEDEDTA